jgi:RNA polymerase sigma factor (sigma-70 family)
MALNDRHVPPTRQPTVFVVDDDAAVRDGLATLLETDGLRTETFDGAAPFLAAVDPSRPGCAIVDVRMPDCSGPELQEVMHRRTFTLPVIFLTAHGDIPTTVRAMKGGALDFLTKPVDGTLLLARVHAALERDRQERERESSRRALRSRLATLTCREQDVLSLAVAGLPNKEIARRLGISFRTVEVHRSRILLKTGVSTLLGLVQLAAAGGLDLSAVATGPAGSRLPAQDRHGPVGAAPP